MRHISSLRTSFVVIMTALSSITLAIGWMYWTSPMWTTTSSNHDEDPDAETSTTADIITSRFGYKELGWVPTDVFFVFLAPSAECRQA